MANAAAAKVMRCILASREQAQSKFPYTSILGWSVVDGTVSSSPEMSSFYISVPRGPLRAVEGQAMVWLAS